MANIPISNVIRGGSQGTYKTHCFSDYEHKCLICDYARFCEEEESKGDVEERKRCNDRGC